jgi:hypothetical protein
MLRVGPPGTMTSSKTSCSVCGEPLEDHTEAICNACGKPYHLNQRSDVEGKDCGQVWISEEHLGLEFACDTCLNPPQEAVPGGLDDVLDIAEAAAAAAISEGELTAAAVGGQIRHRRTSSGTYLFERGDVLDFAQGRR